MSETPSREPTSAALEAVLARERVATEQRHWVRLTRRCNNRCLFCHDAHRQDGSWASLEAVQADILAGRHRGASRVVLSGGEPTLHPHFAEAVAGGRRSGYEWVQAISNGRMFAYERFTEQAVAAGLDEVTVSVHGHTPELHDHLAGVRGAFAQSIRGVKNLLRARRVVSIDVVVTRANLGHLADIMRLFIGLGIREFDLLHLVPYGRAFEEHRAELFFDGAEERAHVLEALRLAEEPGMHVWTNRWPAPLLEGAEHLIQDPHKILDEVYGTREGFAAYLATGEGPECRGERCPLCFLSHFCQTLFEDRERLEAGGFEVIGLDAGQVAELGEGRFQALGRQAKAAYRIAASGVAEVAAALQRLPRGDVAELELDLTRLEPLPAEIASRTRRLVLRRLEDLAAAAALGAELEIPIERGSEELARRAARAAPDRAVLTLEGRALLSEVFERQPPAAALAEMAQLGRTEGLPLCLAPRSEPPRSTLEVRALDGAGRIDLCAWAEDYVHHRFRTKSLRCRSCADAALCPGAHVNAVRAHGFGWMQPREAPQSKDSGEEKGWRISATSR